MEQQTLEREAQSGEKESRQNPEYRSPERERLSSPGQLIRGVLEGGSLLEMPPGRLEELAALVGNQGMAELLERQFLPLEQTRFTLPTETETAPYPVPEWGQSLTAQPPDLPVHEPAGPAFDPAGLVY